MIIKEFTKITKTFYFPIDKENPSDIIMVCTSTISLRGIILAWLNFISPSVHEHDNRTRVWYED